MRLVWLGNLNFQEHLAKYEPGSVLFFLRLEDGDACLQRLQLLPCARQHFSLHIEFFARNQVELGKTLRQQCPRILLEILGRAAGDGLVQLGGEFIQEFGIVHSVFHYNKAMRKCSKLWLVPYLPCPVDPGSVNKDAGECWGVDAPVFYFQENIAVMNKTKALVAALFMSTAVPVMADDAPQNPLTANVSIVGNYLFRGISQTAGKPAVQGGFDYADPSGFYIGTWTSNISILGDSYNVAKKTGATGASLELDGYFGVKSNYATDSTYDIGYLRYSFPGTYAPGATPADTTEVYGALGFKFFAMKYSYSLGNTFGIAQAKGSNYLDVSFNYPVPDTGVTLVAHYGKQTFKGATALALKAAGTDPSYADYKVSVTKDVTKGFVLGASYSKTNTKTGGYYTDTQNRDLGRATTTLSLSRTF